MLRVISSIIVAMAAIAGALDPLVLGLNGALQRREEQRHRRLQASDHVPVEVEAVLQRVPV